ncbi:hypothetical protein FZW96_16820 [Bacillus sp. BGMRC 2118]|nr:hypothetical protein FZW96_16820 [Bacillus sp. BGMRC 2118]
MENRYVKVQKVIEYDAEGGMFISNSVAQNQEIYFSFENQSLSEISIFLTNKVFSLIINEEEKRYIEEQLKVKKWEVMPFAFRKVEGIVWDNYPIIKRVHFSIRESDIIFTAHYKDWLLHTITAPFYNRTSGHMEHTLLQLSEVSVAKIDEWIKGQMVDPQYKII